MRTYYLFLIVVGISCSSCARKVVVNFQSSSENTGTVAVMPTTPIVNLGVTLDKKLVVVQSKRAVKSITINNVPPGVHQLFLSSDSWAYKTEIKETVQMEVLNGETVTHIISRPPLSNAYWAYMGITVVGSTIVSILLYRPYF